MRRDRIVLPVVHELGHMALLRNLHEIGFDPILKSADLVGEGSVAALPLPPL